MPTGKLLRLLLTLCAVAAVCRCQTNPRRRRPPTVPPASAASETEPIPLTSFGQRLTSRPRPAAVLSLQPGPTPPPQQAASSAPAGSRAAPQVNSPDWTPIWPGDRPSSAGGVVTLGGDDVTVATDEGEAVPDEPVAGQGLVDRAPVTEYYFSSTVVPSEVGAAVASSLPPARLPTATFSPSSTPTRRLPVPSSSRRAVFLNSRPTIAVGAPGRRRSVTRLADRLSALVTSRSAQTRIISPTRSAPESPLTSRVVTASEWSPPREVIETVDAPNENSLSLEPSTEPTADLVTFPPTSPGARPVTVTPEAVDPTPASAPCVVTPQGPGGYCRDGDLLTVLTRDPTGSWQEFRVVKLPSATVAALDGEAVEAEAGGVTEDPVGVTEASLPETTGQSTPRDEGLTVASSLGSLDTTTTPLPIITSSQGAADVTVSSATASSVSVTESDSPGTVTSLNDVTSAGVTTEAALEPQSGFKPTPIPSTVTTTQRSELESTISTSPTPESSTHARSELALDEAKAAEKDAMESMDEAQAAGEITGELVGSTEAAVTVAAAEDAEVTSTSAIPPLANSTETAASTDSSGEQVSASEAPAHPTPMESEKEERRTEMPATTPGVVLEAEEKSRTEEVHTSTASPSEEDKDSPPGSDNENDRESISKTPATIPPPTISPPPASTTSTSPSPPSFETFATDGPLPTTSPSTVTSTEPTPEAETPTAATLPSGGAGSTPRASWVTPDLDHQAGGEVSGGTAYPSAGYNGSYTTGPSPSVTTDDHAHTTDQYDYTYDYTTGTTGTTGFTSTGTSGFTTTGTSPPPDTTTAHSTSVPPGDVPTDTDYTTGFSTNTAPTPTDHVIASTERTKPSTFLTPPTIQSTYHPVTTETGGTTEFTSTLGPSTSRRPGITHSTVVPPVEVYVQFLLDTDWKTFCGMRGKFLHSVVELLNREDGGNLTAENAILFNVPMCGGAAVRTRRTSAILVFLYMVDNAGEYDKPLTERVEPLWEEAGKGTAPPLEGLVREVDTIRPTHPQLVGGSEGDDSAGVVVAVVVSCVAVASLVLLAVLLAVVRHRRRAAQAAQRCNPVSMEDYGVESVFSSLRRKNKLRRSVRSYLNYAFDDHDAPSNSVNFAGLANLSGDLAALKEEFDSIPTGVMPALEDLPAGSEDKNRYANVLPVPETRVVLDQKTAAGNTDYINANYVRGVKEEPQFYIATQGPLETTVNDFWRMVWETQSKVILCLTDIVERGVRRCAEYLPPSEALDRHRLYGDFQVTLMAKVKKDKYVVSTVQLKNMDSNLYREVTHLWYCGWPERGVPGDLDSLVQFTLEARKAMRSNIGPTVVHCSPGTGRTGVMLAIDICVRQFEASRTADIMRTVFRVRQDRAGAVQTREQYALIYKVVNQYAANITSGNLPTLE